MQNYLKENNIETLIHYPIPPHKQVCYKGILGESYSVSEEIHKTIYRNVNMCYNIIGIIYIMEEAEYVVKVLNNY